MFGCGVSSNSILRRAARAVILLGPVNVPQEAMYWIKSKDGAGHTLNGRHVYIMHFPAGQLPPNQVFWSLTMSDVKNRFVVNPIDRYSVGDRSGFVPYSDGSIDILIQKAAPAGCESNWLRAYLPGQTILDGKYKVPPVVEAKRSRV